MYSPLKQLMRDHGYNSSEGDDWKASDTAEFGVFAQFVLGVPRSVSHRVLALPLAFPAALARMAELAGEVVTTPTQDELDGVIDYPVDPIPAPAAAPVEPAASVADSHVFDLSGTTPVTPPVVETPVVPPVAPVVPVEEVAADTVASEGAAENASDEPGDEVAEDAVEGEGDVTETEEE